MGGIRAAADWFDKLNADDVEGGAVLPV